MTVPERVSRLGASVDGTGGGKRRRDAAVAVSAVVSRIYLLAKSTIQRALYGLLDFGVTLEGVEVSLAIHPVLALFAASAVIGLVLGFYFSWLAIAVAGLLLAIISAVVLHREGFGFFGGVATIVACRTLSQLAYLIGMALAARGRRGR
jgi:hypothetical protein